MLPPDDSTTVLAPQKIRSSVADDLDEPVKRVTDQVVELRREEPFDLLHR
jgi:hypothetical protein